MCGISVLFQKDNLTREVYEDFVSSLKKIDHRGPDDEGIVLINSQTNAFLVAKTSFTSTDIKDSVETADINFKGYDLAFGHKRLSIVDLSSCGHQPMQGRDGSWIVFNGEIYNYVELREELKQQGCEFKTNSDTEVVLEAYRTLGKNCLKKFNGMWSICIWDAPNKKLFISNDRFGVKPLYHCETVNGFALMSETKQVHAYKNISTTLNTAHIEDFIHFGYVDTTEETMYKGLYRFKKAHFAELKLDKFVSGDLQKKAEKYYTIGSVKADLDQQGAIDKFREILYDSVRIRMRADVNFGFALSGGLDSSAILYTARNVMRREKKAGELLGFSAIFPGHADSDESAFIKIVEQDLPCKTTYSNAMEEFNFEAFERHIYHQDEPLNGTSFFAQWSVYKRAREAGIKILLNGQGADEVFAGYHHHFYRYCRQLIFRGKLPEYFSLVRQYAALKEIPKGRIHRIVMGEMKTSARIKAGIAKYDHSLLKYWNRLDTLEEMLRADLEVFQLPTYLRADDRNSMAFGMESRHPFMDYRLVEFGYSLPNNLLIKDGWQKYIMRQAVTEMPESIRYRRDKKGFTTPQDVWLKMYQTQFEEYLEYNQKVLGLRSPSSNTYRNYALGAWFKVNGI